ncbi:MAG: hypothetical protein AAF411_24710 [Myxococcota bacterium]
MAPPSPAAIMVRESVSSLASRAVADEVINEALVRGGVEEVPRGGGALRAFIEEPLREAAASILGQDAADAIAHMLGPIVHRIPSEIPARLSPAPARPAQELETAAPTKLSTVLLATLDGARAEALDAALGDASLTVVHDVVALLDIVTANAIAHTVIVLDCASPSIHPATLATVAPEMEPGTEFVLWEASDATGDDWLFADKTDTWVRCPAGAAIDQVAKAIRALSPHGY